MATTEIVLATVNECVWDYAGLAHAAHLAGSPGKLIKAVSDSAEVAGYAAGHAAGLVKGASIAGPMGFVIGASFVLSVGYIYLKYQRDLAAYEAAVTRSKAAADAYVDTAEASTSCRNDDGAI